MPRHQQYTPEQKARRAAYARQYRAQKLAAETSEEKERRAAIRRASENARREANREAYNAKQAERRAADRERYRETNRQYYSRHHEKAYLAGLDAGKRYRVRLRLAALQNYSQGDPHCLCCGETTLEFLALDHINGGGNAHRKAIRPTSVQSMYEWAKRNGYPPIFQVLCHNCNLAKGFYGRCPHLGYTG
jgi:hypothetical protein